MSAKEEADVDNAVGSSPSQGNEAPSATATHASTPTTTKHTDSLNSTAENSKDVTNTTDAGNATDLTDASYMAGSTKPPSFSLEARDSEHNADLGSAKTAAPSMPMGPEPAAHTAAAPRLSNEDPPHSSTTPLEVNDTRKRAGSPLKDAHMPDKRHRMDEVPSPEADHAGEAHTNVHQPEAEQEATKETVLDAPNAATTATESVTSAARPRAMPTGDVTSVSEEGPKADTPHPVRPLPTSITGLSGSGNAAQMHEEIVRNEHAHKLDLYVWEYLHYRKLHKTAAAFVEETDLPENPEIPIRLPRGFLYEYWSVFWELFNARSSYNHKQANLFTEFLESRRHQRWKEATKPKSYDAAMFSDPGSTAAATAATAAVTAGVLPARATSSTAAASAAPVPPAVSDVPPGSVPPPPFVMSGQETANALAPPVQILMMGHGASNTQLQLPATVSQTKAPASTQVPPSASSTQQYQPSTPQQLPGSDCQTPTAQSQAAMQPTSAPPTPSSNATMSTGSAPAIPSAAQPSAQNQAPTFHAQHVGAMRGQPMSATQPNAATGPPTPVLSSLPTTFKVGQQMSSTGALNALTMAQSQGQAQSLNQAVLSQQQQPVSYTHLRAHET
mgnify:FL=1